MSKLNLEQLHSLAGFVGAALVDSDSGMALGMTGGTELNLEPVSYTHLRAHET